MTMKLQFAHQDYQKKAVDAVVKVFDVLISTQK